MVDNDNGWSWFGVKETNEQDTDKQLALSFARCFRGSDGERVLKHLRAISVEQALGPGVGDAQRRHVEGQRQLVVHIQGLIERGRNAGC